MTARYPYGETTKDPYPYVAPRAAAKTEALRLFAALSTSERWAYWADECSLSDLFERQIPRDTRVQLNELINCWIADPGEHS